MAQTIVIDSRHHILGDLVLITGTFSNAGGTQGGDILLADHLSKIFAAGSTTDTEIDATLGTKLTLAQGAANKAGQWWALGKR
jgi:hypothetical protein